MKEVWIIERSVNGGAPWLPVGALGLKLNRKTAERLAEKNNKFHATCVGPPRQWRDRAARYVFHSWVAPESWRQDGN